jgi:hypothetical protein
MSFSDQKSFVVTKQNLKNFTQGGDEFRCAVCGHRFLPGDTARWQYMGGTGYPNIEVCYNCDGTKMDLKEKLDDLKSEFMSDRFWFFRKYY